MFCCRNSRGLSGDSQIFEAAAEGMPATREASHSESSFQSTNHWVETVANSQARKALQGLVRATPAAPLTSSHSGAFFGHQNSGPLQPAFGAAKWAKHRSQPSRSYTPLSDSISGWKGGAMSQQGQGLVGQEGIPEERMRMSKPRAAGYNAAEDFSPLRGSITGSLSSLLGGPVAVGSEVPSGIDGGTLQPSIRHREANTLQSFSCHGPDRQPAGLEENAPHWGQGPSAEDSLAFPKKQSSVVESGSSRSRSARDLQAASAQQRSQESTCASFSGFEGRPTILFSDLASPASNGSIRVIVVISNRADAEISVATYC